MNRPKSTGASQSMTPLAAWLIRAAFTLATVLTAAHAWAAVPVDFRQAANTDGGYLLGDAHWINSILQSSNSIYAEGVSVPQRLMIVDIPATVGDVHTLTFRHQAAKASASAHAYDYLTSWNQAVASADAIAVGQGLLADLFNDQCGPELGPPASLAATCAALHTSPNTATPSLPDVMGPVLGDDISASIAAYEAVFGDRTLKVYASSTTPISNVSVSFDGYTGGDPYANYTLTWTSASTEILIEYAGHLASGEDPLGAGIGYGAGTGAASVSGGPYHQILDLLDGASLGNQDNQIKGADIVIPCPTCEVSGPAGPVCPGTESIFTVDVMGVCTNQVITWSVSGNGSISGPTDGTSVTVIAGGACGETYTITANILCDDCPAPGTMCSQTVLVEDTTDPMIVCPADVSVAADALSCTATLDPGTATGTDDCDASVTVAGVRSDGLALNAPYPKGTTTITWTATDDCGNSATCDQTITVSDETPPVFVQCPLPDITVTADALTCDATVNVPTPDATDCKESVGGIDRQPRRRPAARRPVSQGHHDHHLDRDRRERQHRHL